MPTTQLIYKSIVNFGIKRSLILPLTLDDTELVIDLKPTVRVNSAFFGTITPLLFLPSLGYTESEKIQLKFVQNLIEIDMKFAVNYRLNLVPYRQVNSNVIIAVYRHIP